MPTTKSETKATGRKTRQKKLKFKYKILIVTVITIIIMGQTDHVVKAKNNQF